ncbi:hypothetical protein BDV30DRAFT_221003 [Aspergillus minisclerotigenes]|uniref:Uncharacterized protein n=1 Tax=Aspergillus minisclerotigenes TaxID=656917 RepID=A0A5N6IJY6_9EURO|nr:hypothetical protein BDV30DRAFT_221003 [Aspergillus minisclerotigenes]
MIHWGTPAIVCRANAMVRGIWNESCSNILLWCALFFLNVADGGVAVGQVTLVVFLPLLVLFGQFPSAFRAVGSERVFQMHRNSVFSIRKGNYISFFVVKSFSHGFWYPVYTLS